VKQYTLLTFIAAGDPQQIAGNAMKSYFITITAALAVLWGLLWLMG
jgi:hypothetical protein